MTSQIDQLQRKYHVLTWKYTVQMREKIYSEQFLWMDLWSFFLIFPNKLLGGTGQIAAVLSQSAFDLVSVEAHCD